ncbi:MAG: HAD family hydrolase [Bradyrhizobiaceae bacterium]|nr:HAD family hydrolase [Bradyrhizobiaceae bacterium]
MLIGSAVTRSGVVLLDFDGTLAATHLAVIECVSLTAAKLGYTLVERDQISMAIAGGLPLPETFTTAIRGLTPHQVAVCVDVYRGLYAEADLEHSRLFDGVWTTIKTMHEAGVRLAVVSNKGPVAIAGALQRFALAPFIAQVLAADPGLPVKPDPSLFDLRIAPAFPNVPRSAFLMVGDTTADIRFAQSIGIPSCWARYGYGDPIACKQLAPEHEISCFDELLSILSLA